MEVELIGFNPVAFPRDSSHSVYLNRDNVLESKCFSAIDMFRLEQTSHNKNTALLLAYHDRQHSHSVGDLRFPARWKHAHEMQQFDIAVGALFATDYLADYRDVVYTAVFSDNRHALFQYKVPYSPVVLYRYYSGLRSALAAKLSVTYLEQLFVSLSLALRGAVTSTSLNKDFRELVPLDMDLWDVLSKYNYTDRCAFRQENTKPWLAQHSSLANLLGCIRGDISYDSLNVNSSVRYVESTFGSESHALELLDLTKTQNYQQHDLTCLIPEVYRRYYA